MPDLHRGFRHRGRAKVIAALAAAVLPLSLTACGDDDTAGPETGTDVEDITEDDQYFDGDQFVGEEVTVSAEVEEVLNQQSFVLDGGGWGDESLLVVSADTMKLQEDDVVQVTGTVREFTYDDYADEYGLVADPGVYDDYSEEEFLEASSIDTTPESPAPTS